MSLSAFQHGFSTHWMDVDRDPPRWFADVIGTAIDVGYRRIDCNPVWDTESVVGTAIARSSVLRDELFVTTVVPYAQLGEVGARDSITSSLERLGLDRIDLVLVSAPLSGWDVEGTAASLDTLIDEGRVSHVGARYMSLPDLDVFATRLGAPMFAHMTELHPLWQAHDHRRHAVEHGHWIIADSPFMQGMVGEVREIRHIAKRNDATPWQVVLAWLHQLPDVATSTWTHDRDQMAENLAARHLSLDDADIEDIDRIDRRWSGSPHLHSVTYT